MSYESMRLSLLIVISVFSLSKLQAQDDALGEIKITISFVVANDTISAKKEYDIFVNGPFPKDLNGHQGGIKENIKQTDARGKFKLYLVNRGEYEFIVVGKGKVKKKIEDNQDIDLFLHIL